MTARDVIKPETSEGGELAAMRKLSPRRNSTAAEDAAGLVDEQLAHFGIDPASEFGRRLARITQRLYESQADIEGLWRETLAAINHGRDAHATGERADRIARFGALKFLSF